MDEKRKNGSGVLCVGRGLTLSAAVNLFVRTAVRERRLPFEIMELPGEKTVSLFKEVESDLEKGKLKYYDTVESMARELLSEPGEGGSSCLF